MKKTRKVVLSLALAVASITMASCQNVNTNLTTEGVLVVGMECAYHPYNWTETTKSESNVAIENVNNAYAEGYDVQVAKIIAEELNLTLKIKAYEFNGLVSALNVGEIDAIIAGMSPTAERKEAIDFTNDYYTSTHVLLLKTDSKFASGTTLDDFAGARVIGQIGTLYASLVPQMVEHGAIAGVNLDTVPAIVNAILQNTVDLTIVEEPVAKGIIAQYGEDLLTYVKIENEFEVAQEDIMVSIGVRKNFVLTSKINEILTNTLTSERRISLMEEAITKANNLGE